MRRWMWGFNIRWLGNEESFNRAQKILNSKHVEYEPIDYNTVLRASELSFKSNIKINDAIIAQHAIDLKADGIFTDNAKDFEKVSALNIIFFI